MDFESHACFWKKDPGGWGIRWCVGYFPVAFLQYLLQVNIKLISLKTVAHCIVWNWYPSWSTFVTWTGYFPVHVTNKMPSLS